MTRDEFLAEMQDVLQRDEPLAYDMALSEISEWDSLSAMATMAFLQKKFKVHTTFADYRGMETVEDIAAKAGL